MELFQTGRSRNSLEWNMRVLVVYSGNSGKISPFIKDQIDSLMKEAIIIKEFAIIGKGIVGYLKNRKLLIKEIFSFKPDIIHAHYGFSGLLANLQGKVPVITTYHGSDINERKYFVISLFSILLSNINIYVSKELYKKASVFRKRLSYIQPCGVNLENYYPIDKIYARKLLGFNLKANYILFSSSFENKNKNYPLAKATIDGLKREGYDIVLIEYKGYSRRESNLLMNAVDCLIVTSYKESGPLVIKEAMATNTPAVSVDVGDVSDVVRNVSGYIVVDYNVEDLKRAIINVININSRTVGRDSIYKYDLKKVAYRIKKIYGVIKY